jgi:hypothetical protein
VIFKFILGASGASAGPGYPLVSFAQHPVTGQKDTASIPCAVLCIPGWSFAKQNSENNRVAVIPLLSLARPIPRTEWLSGAWEKF